MPLSAATMTDEIVAYLPSEWQPYWVTGQAPKVWVKALCDDIVTMWTTWAALSPAALSPGVVASHAHVPLAPFVAVTTALAALGYTAEAGLYFAALMGVVALHFTNPAMLVTNVNAGGIAHDHTLPGLPLPATSTSFSTFAATAATLQAALKAAAGVAGALGASMPDQGDANSLDIIFEAISKGVVEHVADNAIVSESIDVGAGHTHVVS